jgi:YVTN family beta-propeller protein
MKRTTALFVFFCCALLLVAGALLLGHRLRDGNRVASANTNTAGPQLLKEVGSIELPGPKGKRFDYLTIDVSRHLLFSTHLGAGLLYAIDLETSKVIKTFEDLPGIEGVEIAPDLKKAYTSNWLENKIGVIDLEQMKVIKKIPTESKPDGIAYARRFTRSTSLTNALARKPSWTPIRTW